MECAQCKPWSLVSGIGGRLTLWDPHYNPHFNSSHLLQLRSTHNDLPASPIVRLGFLSTQPPPLDIYLPLLQELALFAGFQRMVVRRESDVGMCAGVYARGIARRYWDIVRWITLSFNLPFTSSDDESQQSAPMAPKHHFNNTKYTDFFALYSAMCTSQLI